MKLAILGASGIGKFHAREFNNLECNVTAILGGSKESSEKTAENLFELFRIKAKHYHGLDELLEKETLDAVSICTPPGLHEEQIRRCLDEGLHVLCEKPLVLNPNGKNYERTKNLFDLAKKKNKILTVNTQWPSVIPQIGQYVDLREINSLEIVMEPGVKGIEMLRDHLPHTNSMLIALCGKRKIENIKFPIKESEKIVTEFDYVNGERICKVKYVLRFKADRPRRVSFLINGNEFVREVGENYQQSLVFLDKVISIEDPFKVSIGKFVGAVIGNGRCLIDSEGVLENVRLRDEIIEEYVERC